MSVTRDSFIADKRILVAGYGLPAEFGLNALFALGLSPENILVLTHAADARNKGLHALCELRKIPLIETGAKDPATLARVKAFAPDMLISLHYRNLIPAAILELAPLGSVNLHPSLLPMYRGTNSVAWVIINGEAQTGFTYHRMDASFDTGTILIQEKIDLRPDETAFSLFHRQIVRAMARFEDVLVMMLNGEKGTVQPEGGSYYNRQLPFDGKIDPAWPLDQVDRFIRAMIFPPFAPAILEINGQVHQVASIKTYKRLMNLPL